jgi:hypothetical protein
MISPKSVMIAVDIRRPARPLVKSPIKIDKPEFTETFPSRIVHRRRFPLLLNGKILAAYLASRASCSLVNGGLQRSSRFLTSKPNNPRLRPENKPDMVARHTIRTI